MRACSCALLFAAGCLKLVVPLQPPRNDMAAAAVVPGAPVDGGSAPTDLSPQLSAPDLSEPPDLLLDPGDLAGGLVACWGVTVCDPSTICIRYISGSPGIPGPPRGAPGCFSTIDPCAGPPSCACIQADPTLNPHCAACFDNQDGSFTCYG